MELLGEPESRRHGGIQGVESSKSRSSLGNNKFNKCNTFHSYKLKYNRYLDSLQMHQGSVNS